MHFLNIRSNLEVHDVRTQWGLHIWAKWRLQRWTKSTVLTTPHWSFSTLFDPSTEGGSLGILSQTFDSLQTIGGLKMWFRMTSDICMEQGSKIRLLCLSVCLSVRPVRMPLRCWTKSQWQHSKAMLACWRQTESTVWTKPHWSFGAPIWCLVCPAS